MGQGSSSERRRRREQITAEATQSIEQETSEKSETALLPFNGGAAAVICQEVRVQQMRRGGHPFTKNDLIALLHSCTGADLDRASQMTCEDLRVAIRVHLYARPHAAAPEPSAPPEYAL